MTLSPPGQYPIGTVNRWTLAGLCFALAVGVSVVLVNEWLLAREVAG